MTAAGRSVCTATGAATAPAAAPGAAGGVAGAHHHHHHHHHHQPPPGYVRAGATGQGSIGAASVGGAGPGGMAIGATAPAPAGGGFHGSNGGAEVEEGGAVKENTGRWTYDEHRLFLRGLELHGKGWKKIASLIRTRTVVQIRTHAQKYFQKIAKAKQNGDHGEVAMDAKGNGLRRKSRGRRRMEDLLRGSTAVAPSLQPYVAGAGAVETGLYRFLSPISIEDLERRPAAGAGGVGEVGAGTGGNGAGSPLSQLDGHAPVAAPGTPLPPPTSAAAVAAAAAVLPPNWYRAGRGVDDLLSEAEGLDWLADSGGAALAVTSAVPSAAAAAASAASAAAAAAAATAVTAAVTAGLSSITTTTSNNSSSNNSSLQARAAPPPDPSSQPLLKKVRPSPVACAMTPSTWSLPPRPFPPATDVTGVVVDDFTPSGLQGSDTEEGHLSGLSDLESLMDDQ
ncbi:unnamed protein product, partial [Pylaiella littoralis]